MWLLVRGRGRGGRYFRGSRKFGIASAKNWRAKYHQTRSLIQTRYLIQSGLWTVAVAPSRVSRMRTIIRRCSKIFCAASHMVDNNKLCGIYLIFHLDLNYIMGSQLPWTVFELLDFLSAVITQLYVCHKRIGIIQGSFGHFYALSEFSMHLRA